MNNQDSDLGTTDIIGEVPDLHNGEYFNHNQFHSECKKIMTDFKIRFIDLAPEMMNDGSDYAN